MGTGSPSVVRTLASLGRRYPLCRGQFWLGRRFPDPTPEGEAIEVGLRLGARVLVYPNEFVGRAVFYFGDLDPRISWVCRRVLRLGDTVVDVGANYGVVSLVAAQLVGPCGAVHAFEPQPHVAALLRRSAERNGFTRLRVHEIGLSEVDAELEMHVPATHFGGASFNRVDGPGSSIKVEVRHAGDFLSGLDLPPIRMLKVDIEGHEAAFLRGGRDFLRRHPPDVILFESNDHLYEREHVPFWRREAVRELHDLGYELVRISQGLGALRPRLIRVRAGDDSGLDFVAIHRSRSVEMTRLLALR